MPTDTVEPGVYDELVEQLKELELGIVHMTHMILTIRDEMADVRVEVAELSDVIEDLVGPVEISIGPPTN